MSTIVVRRERSGVPWRVYVLLDKWPHEQHFHGYHTKRSAEACARILRARSVNTPDALIILRDDVASMRRRVAARFVENGEGERFALEHFARVFSFQLGFPWPDKADFDAVFEVKP